MAANNEPTALFYMGRNVEDLTREELIEALRRVHAEAENARSSALSMNRTWASIAKALSGVRA